MIEIENSQPLEAEAIRALVRPSALRVIDEMEDLPESSFTGYAVSRLAQAISLTEDIGKGHEFASSAISLLKLGADNAFSVWVEMYKDGDEDALPLAKKTLEWASGQTPFVEAIGVMNLGGLHTAERLVRLVEAGDKSSIDRARHAVGNSLESERARLFSDLYVAGDSLSLDPAINSEANREQEGVYVKSYNLKDAALLKMALGAVDKDNTEVALRLVDLMENPRRQYQVHLGLYKKGRPESLQPILEYMRMEQDPSSVQRDLASTGYQPAIDAVRKRVDGYIPGKGDVSKVLDDLVSIYNAGDLWEAELVSRLVFLSNNPDRYLGYLQAVGLGSEAADYVSIGFEADPTLETARELLYFTFDLDAWKMVFEDKLNHRNDQFTSAALVLDLARQIK
jgi:hypothetical protein